MSRRRRFPRRRWTRLLIAWTACWAWGCGSSAPTRFEVSGTVQFDGAPVPAGYIVFEPDAARDNHGPGAGATMVAGQDATPAGQGIVGGPHRVRIHGTDGVPVEVPGEGLNPHGTPLFPEFETHVDFPHADAVHDFEVPR